MQRSVNEEREDALSVVIEMGLQGKSQTAKLRIRKRGRLTSGTEWKKRKKKKDLR